MDATIDAITADVVHDALRAIRYARPLRDSPLIDLRAVGAGLRSESLADTRQSRTWALSRLLAAQVAGRLTELRGGASGRAVKSAGEHEARAHLARDFEGRAFELQAWGLLDYHYFRPEPLTLVQLAEALGVSRNTLDRRLGRGYRLLAERLRAAELEAARQGEGLAGTPVAERILVEEQGSDDGPIELMAALIAVARSEDAVVRVTAEQLRRLGSYPASELVAYRLGRIAEWSQPRYRLDRRFVGMRLLVDAGEDAAQGRWQPQEKRYGDLAEALAEQSGPALVLLGPPGSGKSTLLRRLELDLAAAGLRAGQQEAHGAQAAPVPVTFLVSLARYRPAAPGGELPEPGAWLAGRWAARFPGLPPLERLMAEGPLLLLLDGLNEMPHESPAELRAKVLAWKHFLHAELAPRPGCRAVLACRSLDYSAPLSSPSLRVPQLRLEPLDDAAVRDFLARHNPNQAEAIWRRLAARPILEALRWPFFLGLLCEEAGEGGNLPAGLAGLFTDFLRRGLRRELERDNPLFGPGGVLDEHDRARLAGGRGWGGAHGLPESGPLLRRLAGLARAMQAGGLRGERMQLRLSHAEALASLGPAGRELLAAGEALGVLDEDQVADEVLFQHQLLQEYFAAREMARAPEPERVRVEWRGAQIRPSLDEVIDALDLVGDPLPGLPQTGWEETTLLAATMAEDPASFLRGVMETNLALAGRAAAQSEVLSRLPEQMLDDLRWALVARSRDPEADLRDRIACGYAVGDLGDPRFELREGPHGAYLLPPLIAIPGGTYPIGDDEPIEWVQAAGSGTTSAHCPCHEVEVARFEIGQYAVTNAEWVCFIAARGYEDERWWETEDGQRWRRGELANEGPKLNNRFWRIRFLAEPDLFEQGLFPSEEALERWRGWMAMDEAGFEAALEGQWQPKREVEPHFWRDAQYNGPTQPVMGVSWYEARAYCAWLSAQTGRVVRLPSEVEWEAAAGGKTSRRYAWGEGEEVWRANLLETRVKRTTPVGVFVEGDTPESVADLGGNVYDWTTSLFGEMNEEDEVSITYPYPYDTGDGREDVAAPPSVHRVVRGGGWCNVRSSALVAHRDSDSPDFRSYNCGFRVVVALPASPVPSKGG